MDSLSPIDHFVKTIFEWQNVSFRASAPMNGENQNLLSFVGAMKIARNLAVSGRHIEWSPAG